VINHRDMPGFYLTTGAQAMDLIEKVGADNLYFQYDVYHMRIMEGDITPTFQHLIDGARTCRSPTRPGAASPAPARSTGPSCSR
jgi:hydroxypyruvate isomerase